VVRSPVDNSDDAIRLCYAMVCCAVLCHDTPITVRLRRELEWARILSCLVLVIFLLIVFVAAVVDCVVRYVDDSSVVRSVVSCRVV